jgi:hypothetical protein
MIYSHVIESKGNNQLLHLHKTAILSGIEISATIVFINAMIG